MNSKVAERLNVFVIMPFSKGFDDIFQLGIKETADKLNINAFRLDEQLFDEGMLDRICYEIEKCDFLIADCSTKNANVFYELGYAHAKEKLVILLTSSAEDIPFDLKHKRHIIYSSIANLKDNLKKNLEWAAKTVETQKISPFEVEFHEITSDLEQTKFRDTGKLNMSFNIFNKTESVCPEIHSIYIYSKTDWNLMQDGILCPSTKSNHPDYSFQYIIKITNPKIGRGGWSRIKVYGEKIFRDYFSKQPKKDSYKMEGQILFKLDTAKGVYEYELPINTEFTIDLPF